MMQVAIECQGCHAVGEADLSVLATHTNATCSVCGSADLDLATEASWPIDLPLGEIGNTPTLNERARCSSCFHEFTYQVTGPASPVPPCPNCGSKATSAAAPHVPPTTASGGTVRCPKCGSKAKLTQADGKWSNVCSNCGWSKPYPNTEKTAARPQPGERVKTGDGEYHRIERVHYLTDPQGDDWLVVDDQGIEMVVEPTGDGEWRRRTASKTAALQQGYYITDRDNTVQTGPYAELWMAQDAYRQLAALGPEFARIRYVDETGAMYDDLGGDLIRQSSRTAEMADYDLPSAGESGFVAWLRDMWSQVKTGDGVIPSWFPASLLTPEEAKTRRWGGGSTEGWSYAFGAKQATINAKVAQVAEGIITTNPGMEPRQAFLLAAETVRRYPRVVSGS